MTPRPGPLLLIDATTAVKALMKSRFDSSSAKVSTTIVMKYTKMKASTE